MENTIMGIIGTVMVSCVLLLLLIAGMAYIVQKVRAFNQHTTKNYITSAEAKKIHEGNESINTQLKKLNAAK